jgi:hypothetical protein
MSANASYYRYCLDFVAVLIIIRASKHLCIIMESISDSELKISRGITVGFDFVNITSDGVKIEIAQRRFFVIEILKVNSMAVDSCLNKRKILFKSHRLSVLRIKVEGDFGAMMNNSRA